MTTHKEYSFEGALKGVRRVVGGCPIETHPHTTMYYMYVYIYTYIYIYMYMGAVHNCMSKTYEQWQLVELRDW